MASEIVMLLAGAISLEVCAVKQPNVRGVSGKSDLDGFTAVHWSKVVVREVHRDGKLDGGTAKMARLTCWLKSPRRGSLRDEDAVRPSCLCSRTFREKAHITC